jgi:hypothetical protein
MYTANIVDTGVFRGVGGPQGDHYAELEAAVTADSRQLAITPTVYAELGGDPTATSIPSGSYYVDDAIRAGWVSVTDPVPGKREGSFQHASNPVVKARHDAHDVLASVTNHPKTVNAWPDTSLVGLAIRYFEANHRMRVIIHTTDRGLAKAAQIVIPEYSYHDIRIEYYPPQSVARTAPDPANFTW